ncbi:MAG: Ribosomal RNA large subunit methyltransferase H [Chlamydiae bacterium]|nr:Ribosomal RNA large subunit methyltransferase H [Chlamydiota bacterium]
MEWIHPKDDTQLIQLAAKEVRSVALDPNGTLRTSPDFSTWLIDAFEKRGCRLTLLIGGADGLPKELPVQEKISLSPLTFTHQLTRLVLVEQIYRALEISRGSPYHKSGDGPG